MKKVLATFILFGCVACKPLPSLAQRPDHTPVMTFSLQDHGYRTGAHTDRSIIGFISDKEVVVTINQYGPLQEATDLARDTGQAPLKLFFQGSAVRTLVFDLEEQKLSAKGELGNERAGMVFSPLADGKFIITTEDAESGSVKVFDSKLQLVNSASAEGSPWEREFLLSPLRRWLIFHHRQNADDLVWDANTLRPAKTPHLLVECRIPGDEGCIGFRELRAGRSRRETVYYLSPEGGSVELFTGRNNWMVTADFIGNNYVLVSEEGHWVYTTSGQRVYALSIPSGVWYAQTSLNGARFTVDSAYHTRVNTLLHGLDWNRQYNRQDIRVINTQSGKVVFELSFDPRPHRAKTALSPNGRRLAVLRKGKLEVFELPPVS